MKAQKVFQIFEVFKAHLLHHDKESSLFQLSYVIPLVSFQLELVLSVGHESTEFKDIVAID